MVKFNFYFKVILTVLIVVILLFIGNFLIKFIIEKSQWKSFEATVINVIDGDTIVIDKKNQTVRLLGIDAPEMNHPDYPVQKFAIEAKKYLRKRIEFKRVKIVYNIKEPYDAYNRLLAYVYLNNKLINAELIKGGYAYVYENKKCSKTKEFLILESIAKKFKKGVWKDK
ncbi:MAG: thermonuclease family protein [Candidatus Goldbacteria bacterium]|nr:thermonuclease family protein [Candidatus Goldiibacteriota bacterium]